MSRLEQLTRAEDALQEATLALLELRDAEDATAHEFNGLRQSASVQLGNCRDRLQTMRKILIRVRAKRAKNVGEIGRLPDGSRFQPR